MTNLQMNLTNKQIKAICKNEQDRQTADTYPDYNFKIEQDDTQVKIYWEYLDGAAWTIEKDRYHTTTNEHGELMNDYFEYYETLEQAIRSSVYYMVTRY